ncbi:MAG: nuclear transport factor 2 family protein [Actinomycetota bacterium]
MNDQHQPHPTPAQLASALVGQQVPGWELTDIASAFADGYVNHTGPDGPGGFETHEQWMERIAGVADITGMEVLAVFGDDAHACVLSSNTLTSRVGSESVTGVGITVMRVVDGQVTENWGGYEPRIVEALVRWESASS